MAFYGMNAIPLEGNFGAPPKLTKTESGVAKCTFTVYVNFPTFKDKEGKDVQRPPFRMPCVAWRSTAEYIAKLGATGSSISGYFSLAENTWEETKDGVKIVHHGIEATPVSGLPLNIFTVERKPRVEGEGQPESPTSAEAKGKGMPLKPLEELPF